MRPPPGPWARPRGPGRERLAALLGTLVGIGPGFTQGVRVVTERGKGAQLALGDLADFICTVVQKLALD